jgi:hypothetical protein
MRKNPAVAPEATPFNVVIMEEMWHPPGHRYVQVGLRDQKGSDVNGNGDYGFVYFHNIKDGYNDNIWFIQNSRVPTNDHGPLLYDVAMELASDSDFGLASDVAVSLDACRVWYYYFHNRPDIEKELMPDNKFLFKKQRNMNWKKSGLPGPNALLYAYRKQLDKIPRLDALGKLSYEKENL